MAAPLGTEWLLVRRVDVNGHPSESDGTVTWTVQTEETPSGASTVLVGHGQIPGSGLTIDLRIEQRNGGGAFPRYALAAELSSEYFHIDRMRIRFSASTYEPQPAFITDRVQVGEVMLTRTPNDRPPPPFGGTEFVEIDRFVVSVVYKEQGAPYVWQTFTFLVGDSGRAAIARAIEEWERPPFDLAAAAQAADDGATAYLVDDAAGIPISRPGEATWTLEGTERDPVLIGRLAIAGDPLAFSLRFERSSGDRAPQLRAFLSQHSADITRIRLKETAIGHGFPLAGQYQARTSSLTLVLASDGINADTNIALLQSRDWYEIELVDNFDRRAVLVFRLDQNARDLLAQVLRSWGY